MKIPGKLEGKEIMKRRTGTNVKDRCWYNKNLNKNFSILILIGKKRKRLRKDLDTNQAQLLPPHQHLPLHLQIHQLHLVPRQTLVHQTVLILKSK